MRTAKFMVVALAVAVVGAVSSGCENTKSNPAYCPPMCKGAATPGCVCSGNIDMSVTLPGDMADMKKPPDMTPMCTSSATCLASAPVCSQGKCGSCGVDADGGSSGECATYHASTPLCGPAGACVQCLTKDDCDSIHQTCNTTTNACGACSANADCTSGLCCPPGGTLPGGTACTAGQCIDKSTVLYVNNAPSAACSESGVGSLMQPFCTIQKGLNTSAAGGGKVVVVFPGTGYAQALAAGPAQVGGGNYVATAVGLGAVVKPTASPTLSVLGTAGKQTTITLDGFTFDGSMIGDGSDAIDCAGGGANYGQSLLTITRSTITGGPAIGVSSTTKCKVAMDADTVSNNKGGGIKLDTTDFKLTNVLVVGNGSTTSAFGGIEITAAGEAANMAIANATIVNNQKTAGIVPSGVFCSSAAVAILNTVVFGNSGATQLDVAADCTTTTFSAFPGTDGNAAHMNQNVTTCSAGQLFVGSGATPFMPVKGTAPCNLVDDGTNAGAPDHDLLGTARPQPAVGTDDIGCYEKP